MPVVTEPPQVVVWELTLACNLRCRYCGSAAGRARDAELTTHEALDLCRQLRELEVGRVSLMGGEPLVRSDWRPILECLAELGQPVEIISNGVLVDREAAATMRKCDIYGLSLSLDGPARIHDDLRGRRGSFTAVERGVTHAQEAGLRVGLLTQINNTNLPFLDDLWRLATDWQVDGWQLQLTSPLGAALGSDCTVSERAVVELHQWAVDKQRLGGLHFYFADDIGYFHPAEPVLRSGALGDGCWLGCQAGLGALGIGSDGSVRGCLSLPEQLIEASIRDRRLRDIWYDRSLFGYNRQGHELAGDCAGCVYGQICRGGCASFSFATSGRLGEMRHCWHRLVRHAVTV